MPLILQSCLRIFHDLRFLCYRFYIKSKNQQKFPQLSVRALIMPQRERISFVVSLALCRICDMIPWINEDSAGSSTAGYLCASVYDKTSYSMHTGLDTSRGPEKAWKYTLRRGGNRLTAGAHGPVRVCIQRHKDSFGESELHDRCSCKVSFLSEM